MVEASLEYFILPLVNVSMSSLLLRERPRPVQRLAVRIATLVVVWMEVCGVNCPGSSLPWPPPFVSMVCPQDSAVCVLVVIAALAWWAWHGQGAITSANAPLWGWLVLAGPATAIPLMLFTARGRRLPMSKLYSCNTASSGCATGIPASTWLWQPSCFETWPSVAVPPEFYTK